MSTSPQVPRYVKRSWLPTRVLCRQRADRWLNDLILREGGLGAIVVPGVVLIAYGAATLALGMHLFRVRYSAR